MSTKRKRTASSDADDEDSSPSFVRPLKMPRLDAEDGDQRVFDFQDERNDTQSALPTEPRSGMEDSDCQDDAIQELAVLRHRNEELVKEVKKLRSKNKVFANRLADLELQLFQKQLSEGPIADLPAEMLYEIFAHLSIFDLAHCEAVCKNWQEALCEWLQFLDLTPFNDVVNNGVIKNLTKYHNLESLSLGRCKNVTDPCLDIISSFFPKLRNLDLFGCQVTDLAKLHTLNNLFSLRIGDCIPIDDSHLKLIPPQVRKLTLLWLPGIQNEGLLNLAHMTNLTSLTLEQNDLMKPQSFFLPATLVPSLRKLKIIRQVVYQDALLEDLAKFKNLEHLKIYWSPIVGHGFHVLHDMPNLKRLYFKRFFSMTNAGLDVMTRNLSSVQSLLLDGPSQLTSDGFAFLGRLSSLKDLILRVGPPTAGSAAISDLGFLSGMQLNRLELVECTALTSASILQIVDTQSTLEHLVLRDCTLLQPSNFLPLKRLRCLRSLAILHAPQLAVEDFSFTILKGGGVDFSYRGMFDEVSSNSYPMDVDDDDHGAPPFLDLDDIPIAFASPPLRRALNIPTVVPMPRRHDNPRRGGVESQRLESVAGLLIPGLHDIRRILAQLNLPEVVRDPPVPPLPSSRPELIVLSDDDDRMETLPPLSPPRFAPPPPPPRPEPINLVDDNDDEDDRYHADHREHNLNDDDDIYQFPVSHNDNSGNDLDGGDGDEKPFSDVNWL